MTFLVPKWYFGPYRSILERLLQHFYILFATNFPDIAHDLVYKIHTFKEVIARIEYLRPIYASRTQPWPIFIEYVMGIVS